MTSPRPQNPDPLFSVADAVAYSGLSERTLRRKIADGTLPVVRFGTNLLRVRRSVLDRYLETGDPVR